MDQGRGLDISPAMESRSPPEPSVETIEVEAPVVEDSSSSRSKLRISAILTALYLSLFVAALDQTIISTAVPIITFELHSASGYTWIGGAYILAKAAAMPIWAKLSDIWGRKPIILASLLLFFGSSIICALARTMPALIAGRALQGIGGGGLFQLVTITISDIFSLRHRGLFLGLAEVAWAVAGGVGPVLGGVLAEMVSWRWIFWLNLPIAGIAFFLTLFFLDVHNPRTHIYDGLRAIDWFGTVTILGFTLMVLLGLNFGGVVASWSSAKIICLLVFGVVMSVLFVIIEKRLATYPIMPMMLFVERSNVAAFITAFTHGFVFIAEEYYLPLYLQSAKLASPTRSGLLILPLIVTGVITATATGFLIHRTGEYRQVLQAGMMLTTLGVALFILLDVSTSTATIVGLEILAGVGVGMCFQPPIIAVQAQVPSQDDVASATATLGFLRNMATAVSVVVGGVVFQNGIGLREGTLRSAGLSEGLARDLTGSEAAANVELIGLIEDVRQQGVVKDAFAGSTRNMWILYTSIAACGVIATLFIKRKTLGVEHTETKTGIKRRV
ncbi:putative MFS transporter [Macrophomina phaseolina]|uniref:MFS transporter n=1 Tax=Macrophomina phaseolina TaxID=35725 RepID=A0ABQ8G102_9PEZI|nr:putative MFS transporter [Macrophomina phaseolina]